mgnify:CR=1 FL=1
MDLGRQLLRTLDPCPLSLLYLGPDGSKVFVRGDFHLARGGKRSLDVVNWVERLGLFNLFSLPLPLFNLVGKVAVVGVERGVEWVIREG